MTSPRIVAYFWVWGGVCLCFAYIPGILALSCEPCPAVSCPQMDCLSGGLVLGPCGCCLECARPENGTCGGPFGIDGKCDEGLDCRISPEHGEAITGNERGICRRNSRTIGNSSAEEDPACEDVLCEEPVACPEDSLTFRSTPPGECCPGPSICQCLPCGLAAASVCGPTEVKVLQSIGIGVPERCCDVYECKSKAEVCADVVCDEDQSSNITCPTDSYKLPTIVTKNQCCHKHQGCVCRPPESCDQSGCEAGERAVILHPSNGQPGHCCDEIKCVNVSSKKCYMGDVERENQETWQLDECTNCTCKEGLLLCDAPQCEPLSHCGWMGVPEGACCPVCRGCATDNGKLHPNGDHWQEDSCVTCHCERGQVYCQAQMCATYCTHPRKVPGQCCPVCDEAEMVVTLPPHCPSLSNCSLMCPYGMVKDIDGCYQCRCKDTLEGCSLICPNGYALDEEGREVCACQPEDDVGLTPTQPCPSLERCNKQCAYGYKVNKQGCQRCRCKKCPLAPCKKKCAHGYVYNNKGCKLCKCQDMPTEMSPTLQTVVVPTPPPTGAGRGCMSVDGRKMEDGQSWHDGCRRCFCYQGEEMCALITCPVPVCHNPVIRVGDCCPTCWGEESPSVTPALVSKCHSPDGGHFVEGETWNLDECTTCICHEGGMLCEIESCPPVVCHHPIKMPGKCCPICKDDPSLLYPLARPSRKPCRSMTGTLYSDGDKWRVSACQSCVCLSGEIHCFSQTCPLLTCNKTLLKKGQCCPHCTDSEPMKPVMQCVYGGEVYDSGEIWMGVDDCTKCVCAEGGQTLCMDLPCDPLPADCINPVQEPGLCCPVCRNTTVPSVILTPTVIPERNKTQTEDTGRGPPAGKPHRSHSVAIGILIAIVIILGMMVIILLILLLRTRRRNIYASPKSAAPKNGDVKRPKSTNLDFQGVNPLPLLGEEKGGVDCEKPPLDDKLIRYSTGDERTAKLLLDVPICDTNNYRKSL